MSLLDSLSATNWLPIGPAPVSTPGTGLGFAVGRIEAAVSDPGNGNVVYAAGADGGVWKTVDWNSAAPTWFPLGDFERSLDMGGYHCLVVHPADDDLVLATVSGPGGGVLKSLNGGTTWQLVGNAWFEGASMGSLAVHPTDTSVVYASVWSGGAGGGVYRSDDGGLSWTNTTAFHPGGASDVIVARFDGQTLYAGLVGPAPRGVYTSVDGGAQWTPTSPLPSAANLGATIRLDSAATTALVYVAYHVGPQASAVVDRVKSADGGGTWTQLAATPGTPENRAWHLVLAVDPADSKHLIVNDSYSLYESKNGGTGWTRADVVDDDAIGDDWVNALFVSNGVALVSADRNVYRYASKQKAWTSKEGTLQVTTFYDITPDPLDMHVAYGVSQDHKKALRFDGTAEWSYLTAGTEFGKVLIDPADTDRLYVSNPLDPANFVRRSANGGQTWKTILAANDFAAGDYSLAQSVQRSFAIDPTNPDRLLIGTTRVWETTNATAANPTWTAISGVLGGASASQQYVTALAIAASNPKTVFAATADGHIWVTANGGTSWFERDQGVFGTGAGKIVDIRIDPKSTGRVLAVGSGQGSVWLLHKVAKFLQWSNIAGDLPTYLRSATIYVDWNHPTPALYLGTTRGAYHSVDLGTHWGVFASDLPNTYVFDLQAVGGGPLFAATYGRGAWAIEIGPAKISGNFESGPGFVPPSEPVQGGFVVLDSGGGPNEHSPRAVTDRRGRFVFESVPPGVYAVRRTAPPGHVPVEGGPDELAVFGSEIRGLVYRYRFDPELARRSEPYVDLADLTHLPGREPGQAVGAEDEFEAGG